MKKDGDFMGCVGDLGWYCVRMGLLVFGKDATDAQVVRCQLTKEGVPFEADCLVHFTEVRYDSVTFQIQCDTSYYSHH